MGKLLVVSGTQKSTESLSQLLTKLGYTDFSIVENAERAKSMVLHTSYDIAIINIPLQDQTGIELSQFIAENFITSVIVLVKEAYAVAVQKKTEDTGIFIVTKPLNPALFHQALRFVSAAQKRMDSLHQENKKLAQKVEDLKIIDRAKCCLMEYLKISESAAHRHIEKQAMDMRLSKRNIAENILKTYES